VSVPIVVLFKDKFFNLKNLFPIAMVICATIGLLFMRLAFGPPRVHVKMSEINIDAYDGYFSPGTILSEWPEAIEKRRIEGKGECQYLHTAYKNPADDVLYENGPEEAWFYIDLKTGIPYAYGYIQIERDLITNQEQRIGYTYVFSSKHKKFVLVRPETRIYRDCDPEKDLKE
jgi:hypothetical protein